MVWVEIIASISLGVSIISLLLSYRTTSKINKPAISHTLTNLPPYKSPKETTEIKVKNVGTAQAKIDCIFLKFSWDNDLELFLHDEQTEEEKGKLYLSPNEELTFHKNLPEPSLDKKEHLIIITVYDKDMEKEDTIDLGYIPKGHVNFVS